MTDHDPNERDATIAGRIEGEADTADTQDKVDRQNREADELAAGGAAGSPEEARDSIPDEDVRRGTTHGV